MGICLIEPEARIVRDTNCIIKGIQKILKESPSTPKIIAEQISKITDISISNVEEIFQKLSETGLFDNSGINGSNGLSAININEKAFHNYLRYETITEWLDEFASQIYFSDAFGGTSEKKREEAFSVMETKTIQPIQNQVNQRKVFVVHGQDNEAKESVARFLQRLNLEPIILHEQPNAGKTIIEKFEHHSNDVGYAVVLLTPDDLGCNKNNQSDLQSRARQNVIFELGYFFAKLERKNVCALYKEGVEIPSDIYGIVYVSMDVGGSWQYQLAKEMRQAGLNIDMNII